LAQVVAQAILTHEPHHFQFSITMLMPRPSQPFQSQLAGFAAAALVVLLAASSCSCVHAVESNTPARSSEQVAPACEKGSADAGPVLLQKAVKHSKTTPAVDVPTLLEEAELAVAASNPMILGSSPLLEDGGGTQPQSTVGKFAEGLETGVGLINPLLQRTEADRSTGAFAAKGTSFGERHFSEAQMGDHPSSREPGHEAEEGTTISKVAGTDLLGDPLDPTNHGKGSKESHAAPHHSHGYVTMLFLFGGLILGCFLLMIHERFLHQLPYTCLLFLAGILIATIHNFKPWSNYWHGSNSWYDSVAMWKAIDPHLLFYIFLPALVFSEAMRLNKKLVSSCFWQILLLAGPGVLIGTAMLGTFSHYVLPYGWDWPLCLVIGAILSATDPVAVVALFNTLGVSPRLTMVISGESLMNDGTAFVLFTLMLKVLLGAHLDPIGVAMFFGSMTIVSFILGFVVASLALWVISCCALERGHSDAMVQVVVTICCGYLCFFLAESEFSTSGILTLVSSGFTLAYCAWPRFVSKEVVHTVWEAIEFVGNTIIFLLAGLLFADSIESRREHISIVDFYWLVVMYLACMAARAILVLMMWIPLNLVGKPLSWQEGVVLSWSGLRGAVSLAMAIIVDNEPAISQKMGTRVMFHVGGVAEMTLLINAPLTSRLLGLLGLLNEPAERERMMQHLQRHIAERANAAFSELVHSGPPAKVVDLDSSSDLRFAGADPDIVRSMVPMLIHNLPSQLATPADQDILSKEVDPSAQFAAKCQAYREVFLQVVQNNYWQSIEEGIIPRNNKVARILLGSKDEAFENACSCLDDWAQILPQVDLQPRSEFLAQLAEHPSLSWIPTLTQIFPSAEVIQTWKIYAVLSFQEAHKCARVEVPGYFDKREDLDQQVQELVGKESRQSCEEAGRLLDSVEATAVTFGRSRMLAQRLLRLQLDEVASLEKHGVLNMSESHHLDESIHDALLRVARAETQWQRKL